MKITRPFLILQLRPEDNTADSEFTAILKYGGFEEKNAHRLRIEISGIPENLPLENYSAVIVGGSPFDISTPEPNKSPIQKKIEQDFHRLFDKIVTNDFPFLGACSGSGLLGSYLGTPVSTRYGEAVDCATVFITEEGKKDPLLAGFPDQISVLLGHKEACDNTPARATLRIQTYKYHGYFQPHESDRLIRVVSQKSTPYAQKILRRFVRRYSR